MVVQFLSLYYTTNFSYENLDFLQKLSFKASKGPFQIILDNFLLSRSSFAYDKDFKMHLKILKQKASKTPSQFFDFDSDDDIASSAFLKDHNEDVL